MNGSGQSMPSWFKGFLSECRADRKTLAEDREHTHRALKSLVESVNPLTEHVHRNSAGIHEVRLGLDQTNCELKRTRQQSAKLFRRLIDEVKALRPRP